MSKSSSAESCRVLKEARLVERRFLARPQHEGAGAIVRRSIGRFELKYFDPFLVLDEFSVTAPAGFSDHPHRGFETVTYMLQVYPIDHSSSWVPSYRMHMKTYLLNTRLNSAALI
ncbi:hypothetical protein F2P56_020975 [Juglans regia]|uniref:Pirin N-terminal domain-containing protein n=1 Tax=Juglans regia TaxID=51240 RepID=A0A833X6H1_JUGRE|nr:hypothetical protein F2P56_020975 [Juglans regia]